jgi:hypothetical protein
MQIYLSMMVRGGAKSWPSGRPLRELATNALPNDPLAVHHIFPRELLGRLDFPNGRANTMANYAVISQSDNVELGDREPFEVWRNSNNSQKEYQSDQLCISLAKEDLLKDSAFDDFLDYRSTQIARNINRFLGFERAEQ